MSYPTIDDLLHAYADAVVRRDADQWISTWATDAVWELGKGRRVEGADAILSLWNSAMDGFTAVIQNVVNRTADLDDAAGTGSGRCYIIEHWCRADDSAGSCSPTTTTCTSTVTAVGNSPVVSWSCNTPVLRTCPPPS